MTPAQRAKRELNSRMSFSGLMNAAMMLSHSETQQIRLSNAIAELQQSPKTTYAQLCEVLADHILNELRHGYEAH